MPISSQLYTVNPWSDESDGTFSIARLFFTYGLGVNLFSPWHVGRKHRAVLKAAARGGERAGDD